ncbi:fluoride efflux transporter FluC [Bifidobacterium platyrrhinorum]|uniref:Fluoride-specific ion channel FluC n=1 Tax=Bifidobacterium platyrrhinorum TaxID=2661628 RepID=A0A6L9SQ07_9BIFI|nr:CrcB family protein [Bifidobacterium platyrrhinorum]NEG54544.1 chromosome condensation protein CrcB [Bifidobacterium platyrrhinorum]
MGHRIPQIHPDIIVVVFVGGTIGTALRYTFALIPAAGDFHTGTLAANLLACFLYAGLTAFLAGSASFAARFGSRGKEYASRGLGMGLCGGLSTMSTLALECFTAIRSGDAGVGVLYLVVTFALGILCAAIGAWAGRRLAATGTASGTASVSDVRKEA